MDILGRTNLGPTVGAPLGLRTGKVKPSDSTYMWAREGLSFEDSCKHFVTVGSSGSGKSITLNLLAQSVILKMGKKDPTRRRAIIYDPKSDMVKRLSTINSDVKLTIMNPMDQRFTAWNISADIVTETDAYEFASILIPRNEHENSPYFSDVARSLLAGVVKRFIASTRPGEIWTLRDIVLACETSKRLKSVLDFPETQYLQEHFSKDNSKNYAGVKSTLDNTMHIFRPIAALCDSAGKNLVSLAQWLKEDGTILVLGNSEAAREATDTLNRLIFRQLSKCIIDRPGNIDGDETWIFLDEMREAGALSGLRSLLLRGRSKGVAVALGFQDVEGVYAVYGEHEGAEIIGAAQNVCLLHINPTAPKTAQWASDVCSSQRKVAIATGTGMSNIVTTNTNESMTLQPRVLPIEFQELPMAGKKHGLHFIAATSSMGVGYGAYSWAELDGEYGVINPQNVRGLTMADFKKRPADDGAFKLKRWDSNDCVRLALKPEVLEDEEKQLMAAHPLRKDGKESGSKSTLDAFGMR